MHILMSDLTHLVSDSQILKVTFNKIERLTFIMSAFIDV